MLSSLMKNNNQLAVKDCKKELAKNFNYSLFYENVIANIHANLSKCGHQHHSFQTLRTKVKNT